MMTMGMSSADFCAGEEALVSAAAPVPFEAASRGTGLGARDRGSQQTACATVQQSAAQKYAVDATVTLPIGDLDEAALLQLRKSCPTASITVSINGKTAAGLLARTPIFEADPPPVCAVSKMHAATGSIKPQDRPKSPGEAERDAYLAKTASL